MKEEQVNNITLTIKTTFHTELQKYNIDNKEYISEHKKQYYENNRDMLREKINKYKEHNKEYLKAHSGEKITCECGCVVRRDGILRHKGSAKHKQLLDE